MNEQEHLQRLQHFNAAQAFLEEDNHDWIAESDQRWDNYIQQKTIDEEAAATPLQMMVTAGQTLDSVAQMYEVSRTALGHLNQVEDPAQLFSQDTLVQVPTIFHKTSGQDTWEGVAQQYEVDVVQLKEWNDIPVQLFAGDTIKIPDNSGHPTAQGKLPEPLKSNMEQMGNVDLSDVNVHYNSDKPDQLTQATANPQQPVQRKAAAYAQGTDIYLAPGQEQHLAHEAWHTVQQKQGRVQANAQAKNGIGINNDPALEKEADDMGAKAESMAPAAKSKPGTSNRSNTANSASSSTRVAQGKMVADDLRGERSPDDSANRSEPIQAFDLSNTWVGSAARWTSDRVGDAVDWTSDQVEGVMEMGADAFMSIVEMVAPQLATLINEGPGALLSENLGDAIITWVEGLTGGLDISGAVDGIQESLGSTIASVQAATKDDPKSCESFAKRIDQIRGFIQMITDNPVVDAMKGAFDVLGDIFTQIKDLILAPVFDVLMDIMGGAFDVIKDIAGTIWEWGGAVRDYLSAAWDWVMEQLGFGGDDGEGGIIAWLTEQANALWTKIKATFEPVVDPLMEFLKTAVAFSPLGPFLAAIEYGPELIEVIQWLWTNRDNPNIVKDAHAQMSHTFLPKLLTSVQGFSESFQAGVATFVDGIVEISSNVLALLGNITGIPLLSFAESLVSTISESIQSLATWAQTQLQAAADSFVKIFQKIKKLVEPYIEVLSSIALAALNPAMIPLIFAGWAWRALPECYKPPIIDFLLDVIIGIVDAIPGLPFFGLLWPVIQPFVLGFLRRLKGASDQEKIDISNKLAKIISGASLEFIIGFGIGFLKGIWEGLTDPFKLFFMLVQGLGKLGSWFMSLFNSSKPAAKPEPKPTTPTRAATTPDDSSITAQKKAPDQVIPPARTPGLETQTDDKVPGDTRTVIGERVRGMANELEGPVNTAQKNFMPALEEHFSAGEGMTLDDVLGKLGELWESARSAIEGAGQWLANKIIEFLTKGSAERDMGKGIGWLAGTIVFEVALGILTAGAWQPVSAAGRLIVQIAKVLDWTSAALGMAFKMLSRLGGLLLDAIKALGRILSKAGGAVRSVLDALTEIGQKLINFGGELLGKLGRKGAGEGTDRVARETAETATEKGTRETVETTTSRTTRETTEATGERSTREATEETGENATKKSNQARKAAELPAAMAEAKVIAETNDRVDTPVAVLMGILTATLKPRYPWIKRFGFHPKGRKYRLYFTASPEHYFDEDYTTIRTRMEARDANSVERQLNETDEQYLARLQGLIRAGEADDATLEALEKGILAQEKISLDQMHDPTSPYFGMGNLEQRVTKSNNSLDPLDIAKREQQHADETLRFWQNKSGSFDTVTISGGKKIKLAEPKDLSKQDIEALINHYQGQINKKVDLGQNQDRVKLLKSELEKRNVAKHVQDAQSEYLKNTRKIRDINKRDEYVYKQATETDAEHIWCESREQAQRIVNLLEEAGKGAKKVDDIPAPVKNIRGPEKHVAGEEGPRNIHINVQNIAGGKNIHIYFPE
mgnify:CR=1 FL=1